ncbi:MAG: hypothetical protein HY830_22775 [Actinobacteria bacterium]|nr:hypothetical protein [Actinomycetota bacterium]
MADDGWWSDVTHRDDEVTLEARPRTPRVDLTAHDPQQATGAPDGALPTVPVGTQDGPPNGAQDGPRDGAATERLEVYPGTGQTPTVEQTDLFAPAAPRPAVYEPLAPEQAAAPPPDDDEVPFWLLPAPPRPGMPPARPAGPSAAPAPVPVAPVPVAPPAAPLAAPVPTAPVPTAPAPYAPVAYAPAGHAPVPPTSAAPPPSTGPLPSRRSVSRSGAKVSPGSRAQEVLDRAVAAAGPLLERLRGVPPVILVAAAAFGVGVVVVLVSLLTFGGGDDAEAGTGAGSSARPSAAAKPAPVDLSTVTAEASSEQDAEGSTSYGADNTLDGKVATAWNSDGKADGAGPGITLTYTFDAPVDLRSVSLTNGYQKVIKSNGKNRDLYAANSRVKQVKVVTDGGEWTWTLQDARAPQTLRKEFGRTKTVTLEILSVYKGAKYSDTAISEVSFTAVG